jgi:RNA polymerase sigma-70 factor (ECF subfamily)
MAEALPRTTPCCSARAGAAGIPSDSQLLNRFAGEGDEQAFAMLVERHGPLVLAVCWRVLGAAQDAEDAFQATFLVLARKAGRLRNPELLGNWLYGVASRIARKARIGLSKRRARENHARALPLFPAPAPSEGDDAMRVLAEELSRLPVTHRAAVGLCYVEGKTNAEAARLLRWPIGTVKGRLARARALLRDRLILRGFGAFAILLTALLSGG